MSATTVVAQLKGLLEKTEHLKGRFSKVYPTDDQWDTLSDLSLKLSVAVKVVQDEIRVLQESRTERAWKESEEHRSKAQSLRGDFFATGRLKQPAVFRRSIITIFGGPKDSKFDSEDVRFRKESTRKRCELIRGLSPDGVISWAIAFAPTLWAGGSMASDVFTCLLDDIEPELVQVWPPVIRDTLQILMEDEESLQKSPEYGEFLKATEGSSPDYLIRHRKRRRIEAKSGREEPTSFSSPTPSNESKEMKHTHTESASHGDVFALTIEDARYAMSSDQGVRSIFLTNPDLRTESSFLTAWVSKEMGTYLGERGQKLDYKYRPTKGVEGLRREI